MNIYCRWWRWGSVHQCLAIHLLYVSFLRRRNSLFWKRNWYSAQTQQTQPLQSDRTSSNANSVARECLHNGSPSTRDGPVSTLERIVWNSRSLQTVCISSADAFLLKKKNMESTRCFYNQWKICFSKEWTRLFLETDNGLWWTWIKLRQRYIEGIYF